MTRAPLSPLHSFECIGSLVRVSTLGPRPVLVISNTSPPEALPAGREMRLRPEHTCCYCVCLCRIVVAGSADTHGAGTDGERKQKWEGEGELKSSDMSVGKCTLPTRVVGICPRHPFPITCSGKSSFPVLEAAPSSHWRQRWKTPGSPSWLPCWRSEHRSERPGSMRCHCSELRVHASATFASLLRQESPVGDQRRACFCSNARSLAGQPLATPASAATRQSPGRARADPPSSAAHRSRPLGPVF